MRRFRKIVTAMLIACLLTQTVSFSSNAAEKEGVMVPNHTVDVQQSTLETDVQMPKAGKVTIGEKVKDSEISTDGIHAMGNTAVVKTKSAFIKKMYAYMNARKTSFTIVFKGSYKKIYVNNNIQKMFAPVWAMDNKNTSDDFDYLYLTIDSYRFRIPAYSKNKSVFKFNIKYLESKTQVKKVNTKVKSVLAKLKLSGKSRVEQIRAIHNYIAETITYDNSLSRFSAYDGLVSSKHTTVCQGYALSFYKMCTEAGIPCRAVTGYGYDKNGKGVRHAWNIVKIGSQWYYVDTTWDDLDLGIRPYVYSYFLIGSNKMLKDHSLHAEYKTAAFKKKYPISKTNYNWSLPEGESES